MYKIVKNVLQQVSAAVYYPLERRPTSFSTSSRMTSSIWVLPNPRSFSVFMVNLLCSLHSWPWLKIGTGLKLRSGILIYIIKQFTTFLNVTLIMNQYLNTMPPFFSSLGPPTEEEAKSADITFCSAFGRPENRGSLKALRKEFQGMQFLNLL